MTDIISVTEEAIKQIKKIVSSAAKSTDGILVGVDKSGCSGYSYKISYAENTDKNNYEIIERKGIKIYIDPKATMHLLGSEMDYKVNKFSSGFVFKNPNTKNVCGCGESFQV